MAPDTYRHDMYVVVWDDSQQHSDGHAKAPVHAPARQVRIGWLVKNDHNGVTVASEYNNDDPDSVRDEHFIPEGNIVSIDLLYFPQ